VDIPPVYLAKDRNVSDRWVVLKGLLNTSDPDGMAAALAELQFLAEAVLLPSKTLAQGFATNVFLLNSGKVLTGFVVKEAADKVTIRDAEARETVIPVASIDERSTSPVSVMPEGLVRDITVPEFASLLDYLEALARKK